MHGGIARARHRADARRRRQCLTASTSSTARIRTLQTASSTRSASSVAGRWHDARKKHEEDLLRIEGNERYAGLQRFFAAVRDLTARRKLARTAYVVEKPA